MTVSKIAIDQFKAMLAGIKITPRRPYDQDFPGYLEGDRDYVLNNLDACVEILDYLSSEVARDQSR